MTTTQNKRNEQGDHHARQGAFPVILIGGLLLLIVGMAVSIAFGATTIDLNTVWTAIIHYDSAQPQHQVVWDLRLPRVVGSVLVGASFAVAGALMQGMTRNPLADSGILGLNAGSAFVLAFCYSYFPGISFSYLMMYSFLGAGIAAGVVYGIGSMSKTGLTPLRLVLAGSAVSALLVALSQGLAIYFQIGQDLAYWYAGGLSGIEWPELKIMFPWVAGACIAAMLISRSITVLSLGDDVAAGLGQRSWAIRLAGIGIVLVLAGASVSMVGSIGFVGLIVPHAARYLVGMDYRRIIPCSAVLGSLLMLAADLGSRRINPPMETPVGALLALIGIPFFLYLARRKGADN